MWKERTNSYRGTKEERERKRENRQTRTCEGRKWATWQRFTQKQFFSLLLCFARYFLLFASTVVCVYATYSLREDFLREREIEEKIEEAKASNLHPSSCSVGRVGRSSGDANGSLSPFLLSLSHLLLCLTFHFLLSFFRVYSFLYSFVLLASFTLSLTLCSSLVFVHIHRRKRHRCERMRLDWEREREKVFEKKRRQA